MIELIGVYLPWLLSAITIYMTILAGNKHRRAWAVGLLVSMRAWGLLPMNAALWVVYARNHFKWREAK